LIIFLYYDDRETFMQAYKLKIASSLALKRFYMIRYFK